MVGNYLGEVLFVPNTGNAQASPSSAWQGSIDRMHACRPTTRAAIWANLISPVAYDWTGTGSKLDLICGEGTYSANTIHLLENISTGDTPKFSSARDKHTYLAYGDGREQLIPGRGRLRRRRQPRSAGRRPHRRGGRLSQSGQAQSRRVELKRSSTITFGGTSKLPGLCSIYARPTTTATGFST